MESSGVLEKGCLLTGQGSSGWYGCTSVVEVFCLWEQGPASAGSGTSRDGIGLVGYSSTSRWVTHLFGLCHLDLLGRNLLGLERGPICGAGN